MFGIVLVDKPLGLTSHDAIHRLRRVFGLRRIGHSGTLDPAATGLLVVAVGPATRFLQYLDLEPKVYEATIRFGQTSNTFDTEGELSDPVAVPSDLETRLQDVIPSFLGLVEQVPPMHSAVKVKGQPLYRMARQGVTIERAPRTIHIGRLDVRWVDGQDVGLTVECSGGTYIRTLADDLGRAVGVGAYLAALQRIRSGRFHLDDAVELDAVDAHHVLTLREALPPMPIVGLDSEQSRRIRTGSVAQSPEDCSADKVAVAGPDGEVIGVARVQGRELHPECVLPIEVCRDPL